MTNETKILNYIIKRCNAVKTANEHLRNISVEISETEFWLKCQVPLDQVKRTLLILSVENKIIITDLGKLKYYAIKD